jgi:DNA-directed RNA polymerase specialized sigma24 family protein
MAKERVVVTEDELEGLLQEDPKFAVAMIDSDYRENIWRYIRSRCRYFDDDDVHEVYKKTLKDFIRCVKKPDFDPRAPLKLIFHIAKLRAIDRRRAKKVSAEPKFDELLEPIAQDMKDTTTRLNWQLMKANWPEFRAMLEKLITQLPDKQRDAMNAFVETYWEIRTQGSMRRLAEHIRQQYGYDCTASQAADNVRAAIETLEPKLTRAGFNLLRRD